MQQILLELDGIKGETDTKEGKAQIELLSFSHGVSMPLSHGTGPSNTQVTHGRANFGDVSITKYVDKATPLIHQWCAGGKNITKATIRVFGADTEGGAVVNYYAFELTDVIITSASIGGGGGDLPIENVSFYYNTIVWGYKEHKHDNSGAGANTKGGWDRMANEAKSGSPNA